MRYKADGEFWMDFFKDFVHEFEEVSICTMGPDFDQDGQVGMISHKNSLITIFGHKHKIKNFIKKLTFLVKKFYSLWFWFIFGMKLLILNQNCIKNAK